MGKYYLGFDAGTQSVKVAVYDENMNQLSIIDLAPVPNKLIPEHDGNGQYIDIVISQKGYITNWYNEPSFEEFKF